MEGLIEGTTHLCQGQEAVAVGAISALRDDDYLTVTYRGHGHALMRGVPMEACFAELMGRSTGCCRGVGGSMHFTDVEKGLLGAFAIVGAGLPVALGAAYSAKLQGLDRVALTFFGDGASNIGTFHEAINTAAAWKVGIVFIVENNLYGEYTPLRDTTPLDDLAERAKAYGIPGVIVDGQDVDAVHAAVSRGGRPGARRRGAVAPRDEDVPLSAATRAPIRRGTAPRASSRAGRSAIRSPSSGPARGRGRPVRGGAGSAPRRDPAARRRHCRPGQAGARARPSRRSAAMSTQLEPAAGAAGDAVEMTCREAVNAALEDEMAADPSDLPAGRGCRRTRVGSSRPTAACRSSSRVA